MNGKPYKWRMREKQQNKKKTYSDLKKKNKKNKK